MNALYHLAKADFLERVRRYSFLVTLAFAVYIGLAAARGQISLRLGDYSGRPNSAWVGTLMSLTTTVFLSLVGFYIVANSIQRDQQTRVGRILAATPMSRFAYMFAKALSNFAVLSAMVAVLAIAGVAIVFLGRTFPLEPWKFLAPFLFIALPTMAVVAGVAVFFEATPILRRISSVTYFFLWTFVLSISAALGTFDITGMHLISTHMIAALHAAHPNYDNGISFGFIAGSAERAVHQQAFLWTGIPWTMPIILSRLLLLPAAAALALIPALWFHRFDPSREGFKRKPRSESPALPESTAAAVQAAQQASASPASQPANLPIAHRQTSSVAIYLSLIACELRLLAARRTWWIYSIAAGLTVAGFALPLDQARHGLVAAILILPMLFWSRLGAREDFFATRTLIFSAPQAAIRPLLASWLAGAALPLVLASGVILRLLVHRDFVSAAALVVAAFFAVALALAVGNLARTPKAFEALYVAWWYVGPLQANRGPDFAGVTQFSAQPALFAALTLTLILAAWAIRTLRQRRA